MYPHFVVAGFQWQ